MLGFGARSLLGAFVAAAMMLGQATPGAAEPPAPIWNGVYVGIHGGHASADLGYTFVLGFVADEKLDHSASGWFGGGHVGVQRQWGRIVGGIEASYSALNLSDTKESTVIPGRFRQVDIDDLFTLGLRLGYAFDRWMPYVKAGYASASVDTVVYATGGAYPSPISSREDGWFIGAGLEFFCARGFTLGLEYNYVSLDLDDRHGLLTYDKKPFAYKDFDSDIHTVSARLSYKFGNYEHRPLK
jgi:opacity protein-like surface antigen